MKLTKLLILTGCLWSGHLLAQNADTLVLQGRTALANHDLLTAQARFASSVQASPNHQAANVFLAATRLLAMPQQPAGKKFLDRLKVGAQGRDLYDWTASFSTNAQGDLVLPAGYKSDEILNFVRTNIIPTLAASRANLAKIQDPGFLLELTADETSLVDVALDYGDILLLQALLYSAEVVGYTSGAHNLLGLDLQKLISDPNLSIQTVLTKYPRLLDKGKPADLAGAKSALTNAANFYLAASDFIRNNRSGVGHLFELYAEDAEQEAEFRSKVEQILASLNGKLDELEQEWPIHAPAFFAGSKSLRSMVPKFDGNRYIHNSLPDYTFGGILTNTPACDVEEVLRETLSPSPAGYYEGWFYTWVEEGYYDVGRIQIMVQTNNRITMIASIDWDGFFSVNVPLDADGDFTFKNQEYELEGTIRDGNLEGFVKREGEWLNIYGHKSEETIESDELTKIAGYYTGNWSSESVVRKMHGLLLPNGAFIAGFVGPAGIGTNGAYGWFYGDMFEGSDAITPWIEPGTKTISGEFATDDFGVGSFNLKQTEAVGGDIRPEILSEPGLVNVVSGGTAQLVVNATGSPPLCYQWFRYESPIPGATSATLRINNCTEENVGEYWVEVRNVVDEKSAWGQLNLVPEIVRPVVTITNPKQNQVFTETDWINVTGTATDNAEVVQVFCQLNGGEWFTAQFGENGNNWLSEIGLEPGTNVVRAYSEDSSGNVSLTNAVTCKYVEMAPIWVEISGLGTVTPNYNEQLLELGKLHSMTAKPGKGFAFLGWEGAVETNHATVKFLMDYEMWLVARFIDVEKPTIKLTAPTTTLRTSNNWFTIRGTAADNYALEGVYWQRNGEDPNQAGGTTTWATELELEPGTNVFTMVARDEAGNQSNPVKATIIYVVMEPLTITINGEGMVNPDYNDKLLEVGKAYTITAVPDKGHIFSYWGGSVEGDAAKLTFTMEAGMALEANFIPNPFVTLKGSYNGLFQSEDGQTLNHGLVTANVTENGGFSAKFTTGGKSYPLSGTFDAEGRGFGTVKFGKTNVQAMLMINEEGLEGELQGPDWFAGLWAVRAPFSATNPCTYEGKYTVLLNPVNEGAMGFSPGTLTVDKAGKVKFTLQPADGSPAVTVATAVSENGVWPFYASLYSGKGFLSGWVYTFEGGVEASIRWVKPASTSKLYPEGFDEWPNLGGSTYTPPIGSIPIVEWLGGLMRFDGGGLVDSFENSVTWRTATQLLNNSANKLSITIKAADGSFSGSVTVPGTSTSLKYKAVFLQGTGQGYGFFTGTTSTGPVLVFPSE